MNDKLTSQIEDDEVTERTETFNVAINGGQFDIVLDVKKINTTKSIERK